MIRMKRNERSGWIGTGDHDGPEPSPKAAAIAAGGNSLRCPLAIRRLVRQVWQARYIGPTMSHPECLTSAGGTAYRSVRSVARRAGSFHWASARQGRCHGAREGGVVGRPISRLRSPLSSSSPPPPMPTLESTSRSANGTGTPRPGQHVPVVCRWQVGPGRRWACRPAWRPRRRGPPSSRIASSVD
jgi:hypothetical protein